MAHELTSTDGLVLHKQRAWHGLGTIVEQAPTPREALQIAGLDWSVEQWALSATDGESARCDITTHVANVRKDTGGVLGIVGKDWTPFQNAALADFCESLQEQGAVRCETAGSIRGGAKVWFLLKGEAFDVRKGDTVFPYVLVSNGFDGGTALRCTPTTVRVVCSNTLHMVIPRMDSTGQQVVGGTPAAFTIRHMGNLQERVAEAREALKNYGQRLQQNRDLIDALAVRDLGSKQVERFFLECFTEHFGAVADNPKDGKQQRHRDKAMDCIRACVKRFEAEQSLAGPTAWNAFNSYSGWLQHDRSVRIKNPVAAAESRLHSNLFGENAERTVDAFTLALHLAS